MTAMNEGGGEGKPPSPSCRKLLQEMLDAWRDFDAGMQAMSSENLVASEEQHFARLIRASARWQKAMADAEDFLERPN